MQEKLIIPWKCHICGRQFDTLGGGICKKCGMATCAVCFGIGTLRRLGQMKVPKGVVCRTCAGAEETKTP